MTEKKDTPQEIDLIELFTNIGKWISDKILWLFNIGLRIFYFFIRKSLWLLLFILIGGALGYFSYQTQSSKPSYKTNIFVRSYTLSSDEVIQIINNWNYYSEFKNNEQHTIKNISASFLLDKNEDGQWDLIENSETIVKLDTALMNQRVPKMFCIQSEVSDTVIIPKLREKVLNLITNNERVTKLNAIRLKNQEALIPKIQKEIADLDSLKRMEYFGKDKVKTVKIGEVVMLTPKETKLYHTDVLSLYREQQAIEEELFLYNKPFEITLEYTQISTAAGGESRTERILNYIKKFFLLGFIIVLIIDQRKFILNQIKRSKEIETENI